MGSRIGLVDIARVYCFVAGGCSKAYEVLVPCLGLLFA